MGEPHARAARPPGTRPDRGGTGPPAAGGSPPSRLPRAFRPARPGPAAPPPGSGGTPCPDHHHLDQRRREMRVIPPVLLLGLLAACQEVTVPSADLARDHATIVNPVEAKGEPDRTVLDDAGRIVAVAPSARVRVPEDSRVVDATGRFVIPGLWDTHVH